MIMKTIKYFAAFLCAALVMGACAKTDGLSDQNAGKEKPVVEIVQKVATDLNLQFDLKVTGKTNQFGYVVMSGHGNSVPTPVSILANEVSGAQAGETFWYEKGDEDTYVKTVTLDCSAFKKPSDKYQVFAVAITADGLAGEVVTLDVTMNDKTAPAPISFGAEGNTLQVEWAEDVVLGTGKAYVSILAWGVNKIALNNAVIEADNLSVEGNVLTIVCPEAGNGAGYIVSLESGVVKDLSGNPSPAIKSGLDEEGEYVGLGWDTPNVEIPITAASFKTPAEDVNWAAEDANLVFTLPTEVMVNTAVKNPISVIYNEAEGVSQLFAEWTLAEDNKTVTVYLPKMPTGEFDVVVKANAFFDVWNNKTSAFEPATLRYSNFLVELKPGYYMVDYAWDTQAGTETSKFLALFEQLDGQTVLMSADWFELMGGKKLALPTQMVGVVDYSTSTVVFDGRWLYNGKLYSSPAFGMKFYNYDEAGTQGLVFFGGGTGADPIVVKFNADGYFTEISLCEYGVYDLVNNKYLGSYSYCPEGSKVTFLQAAAGAVPQMTSNAKAPVSSIKFELKSGFNK